MPTSDIRRNDVRRLFIIRLTVASFNYSAFVIANRFCHFWDLNQLEHGYAT